MSCYTQVVTRMSARSHAFECHLPLLWCQIRFVTSGMLQINSQDGMPGHARIADGRTADMLLYRRLSFDSTCRRSAVPADVVSRHVAIPCRANPAGLRGSRGQGGSIVDLGWLRKGSTVRMS